MKRSALFIIPLITCVTLVACSSCISTPSQTAAFPVVSSVATSATTNTYRGDLLSITFDYPSGWFLQDVPEEPFEVLLTSYDPASPPHKLEWNEDTVSIRIRLLPVELSSDSLEVWVENAKLEATAAYLSIFAEERLMLVTGLQAAHITVVSGSGGILEYVLVILNGDNFEIVIEGNFALAKTVLDTLQPMTSD
ncbi:MAG TPA: hypothetical protein G4O11_03250 [Anaerolineae bacterium]|nr:MAG: hypothetical protein AMJ88_18785 [Anaerolineae bacterium SM23_ 63]HEY42980.1 hypothetical protein [Anaerolineae bacterium]